MFIYCNVEKLGNKINDCVIRAITLGMGIPYENVVHYLYMNGLENGCDSLNIDCYSKLFSRKFKLKRHHCKNTTVQKLCERYPDSVLIIRCPNHLTLSMFGNVFDTFDCTEYKATDYWLLRHSNRLYI